MQLLPLLEIHTKNRGATATKASKARAFKEWTGKTIYLNFSSIFGDFFFWKEYFPNLLETWFWGQIFVYWARYFKFWLLAYFLILLNCAKFEKDWTTFILDILQGSPFEFLVNYKNKKHQRGGWYMTLRKPSRLFDGNLWRFIRARLRVHQDLEFRKSKTERISAYNRRSWELKTQQRTPLSQRDMPGCQAERPRHHW